MNREFCKKSNNESNTIKEDNEVQNRLNEFHKLIAKLNNKVMLTHELAINTDEMVEDALL